MTEIKVLIEGYVRKEGDVEEASCTTTLIKDNNLNIIVDPGIDWLDNEKMDEIKSKELINIITNELKVINIERKLPISS